MLQSQLTEAVQRNQQLPEQRNQSDASMAAEDKSTQLQAQLTEAQELSMRMQNELEHQTRAEDTLRYS